jgi:glycosyltransferase involved in cell wall biosynthesis
VCVVSTVNHLHLVLNLVRAIRATWSAQPRVLVALADHGDGARPGFDPLDVEFVDAAALGIPNYLWLAAKYDATELCCAVKPFLVRHALDRGYRQVVYCDADLHFFAEPTDFLALGEDHDVVVTPHTLAPFAADEAWQRPTLGDLHGAGLMNAGLFSVRASTPVRRFLDTWSELVAAPGAFLLDLGGQHEQNHFNWVVAFVDDVAICRDRTINVAYWNLHERPVRWCALDGGSENHWTVDGRPLGCFHFSGFAWHVGQLSKHDFRHWPALDVNVDALCRFYAARLEEAEADVYAAEPYAFAEIDGQRLTPEVRDALKRAEQFTSPVVASWHDDSPALLRGLHRVLGPTHVVPQYLERVLALRPDLRALNAEDSVFPERFLAWVSTWFGREYPHGWLFERYCEFAWERAAVDTIAAELERHDPRLSVDAARELVIRDRARALDLVDGIAEAAAVARLLEGASYRFAAYDPALCLRLIYFSRKDLRAAFPDPLGEGLAAFRSWIAHRLRVEYELPEHVAAFAEALAPSKSLARVVSFLRSNRELHERLATSGIDVLLLRDLVPASASGAGFTATDLVLVDWWLRGRAAAVEASGRSRNGARSWLRSGARGALELVRGRRNGTTAPHPAAATPNRDAAVLGDEARAVLLDRLVVREPGDPRFATYLSSWLDARDGRHGARARRRPRLTSAATEVVTAIAHADRPPFATRTARAIAAVSDRGVRAEIERLFAPDARGVNVFGYFQSPIGLGTATLGVCRALELAGYEHRDIVLSNMTMSSQFDLEHLVPDFAFNFPRNLVVSYPHIQCDAFDVFPACFFSGRETIGYLAWEQRDLHPAWAERMARFDRMFALSEFAARSLARGIGRPVGVLPCVVEVDAERAASYTRADFGIPVDAFAVGFVFDASSSTERKNPLGAVRAVTRAFGRRRDVVVVMKITNGDRYPYTRRVDEVVRELAGAGLASVVITSVLPRAAVEGLMATLDLYVSLHRAEGFGYTLAEAMLLGVPALATRYSGNLDFMSDDNSWLVDCRETLVRQAEGPFRLGTVWADPDLDDAADKCRCVYEDRDEARRRAERARREVRALLSPQAVARRLAAILDGEAPSLSRAPAPSAPTALAAKGDPGTP